jgi:hypothetical protein
LDNRIGMETAYFSKQEFWPFVKSLSGILNLRGPVPNGYKNYKASNNTK